MDQPKYLMDAYFQSDALYQMGAYFQSDAWYQMDAWFQMDAYFQSDALYQMDVQYQNASCYEIHHDLLHIIDYIFIITICSLTWLSCYHNKDKT